MKNICNQFSQGLPDRRLRPEERYIYYIHLFYFLHLKILFGRWRHAQGRDVSKYRSRHLVAELQNVTDMSYLSRLHAFLGVKFDLEDLLCAKKITFCNSTWWPTTRAAPRWTSARRWTSTSTLSMSTLTSTLDRFQRVNDTMLYLDAKLKVLS